MNLEEMIYKRRSHRDFEDEKCSPEVIEDILEFIDNAKPLFEDIGIRVAILGNEDISSIVSWKAPHYITIFSQKKEGYLENVGFIFQQLDLYLASIGIGSVWYGLAKFKPKTAEAEELANLNSTGSLTSLKEKACARYLKTVMKGWRLQGWPHLQ